ITAGVPGLGLSGLFVLLSGLALPLARRWRGQGVPVARLFGLAAIMTAAIIVTWVMIFGAATALHTAAPTQQPGGTLVSHRPRGRPGLRGLADPGHLRLDHRAADRSRRGAPASGGRAANSHSPSGRASPAREAAARTARTAEPGAYPPAGHHQR